MALAARSNIGRSLSGSFWEEGYNVIGYFGVGQREAAKNPKALGKAAPIKAEYNRTQ